MASSFSTQSPKIFKGALAFYPPGEESKDPVMLPFQYNPNQIRRTLTHRAPRNEAKPDSDATPKDMRLVGGPPVETLNISIELTATDALENPNNHKLVAQNGLYPALASLEMLMYAPSFQFEEIERLAKKGETGPLSPILPLTMLVLGESRVIPIYVTSFSITEEGFDTNLNPIRAKVDLGMQILTNFDALGKKNQKAVDVYVAYQKHKEKLAREHQGQTQAGERTTRLSPE